eukprot:2012852-Amphidinium_carterae.1
MSRRAYQTGQLLPAPQKNVAGQQSNDLRPNIHVVHVVRRLWGHNKLARVRTMDLPMTLKLQVTPWTATSYATNVGVVISSGGSCSKIEVSI